MPAAHAEALARRLLARPSGADRPRRARLAARLEAGLCSAATTWTAPPPVEASLGWAISKARRADGVRASGFPGAERIFAQQAQGVAASASVSCPGRMPVREGLQIVDAQGRAIGRSAAAVSVRVSNATGHGLRAEQAGRPGQLGDGSGARQAVTVVSKMPSWRSYRSLSTGPLALGRRAATSLTGVSAAASCRPSWPRWNAAARSCRSAARTMASRAAGSAGAADLPGLAPDRIVAVARCAGKLLGLAGDTLVAAAEHVGAHQARLRLLPWRRDELGFFAGPGGPVPSAAPCGPAGGRGRRGRATACRRDCCGGSRRGRSASAPPGSDKTPPEHRLGAFERTAQRVARRESAKGGRLRVVWNRPSVKPPTSGAFQLVDQPVAGDHQWAGVGRAEQQVVDVSDRGENCLQSWVDPC